MCRTEPAFIFECNDNSQRVAVGVHVCCYDVLLLQEIVSSTTKGSENHRTAKHVRIHTDYLLPSEGKSARVRLAGCGQNRDSCELSTHSTVKLSL